MTGTPSPN